MAQRLIWEHCAKQLLSNYISTVEHTLSKDGHQGILSCHIHDQSDLDLIEKSHLWLKDRPLVVKPDQLIGKRGKNDLILINESWSVARLFLKEQMGREVTINNITGTLNHFIIEPYIEHDKKDEMYLSIASNREHDTLLFSLNGGVDIEEHQDSLVEILIPIQNNIDISSILFKDLPKSINFIQRKILIDYLSLLYQFFIDLDFAFLEINPLALTKDGIYPLDMKARLDDTALFQQKSRWGNITFPAGFGDTVCAEEKKIQELNNNTGASLKLTILNPAGKIWLLIAGGGASVIYTDTLNELGHSSELANYGEYSGNPSANDMYDYTSTILNLMVSTPTAKGESKYLLIGGGVANFTDVAATFIGIIRALRFFKDKLIAAKVKILVRRGGPNYQTGLNNMMQLGEELGIPIEVYGPETHMTHIVRMGLEKQ